MQIGIELKPFNHTLKSRRLELGWTQKELAEVAGVSVQFVSQVETLKLPFGKFVSLKTKLNKIAQALEIRFEVLFPADYLHAIQRKILPRRRKPLIWEGEVRLLEFENDERLLLPSPEDEFAEIDYKDSLKPAIAGALATLTERQAQVIRLRFGLDDENGKGKTIDELATLWGVTRERVRQIEAKAMKKLRHPIRSRKLREYRV